MQSDIPVYRILSQHLLSYQARHLVMLTGARQTGKTTLALQAFPNLRYVNLDLIETREQLRAVHSADWVARVGPAILDEAQKEPLVFDKVKAAFDSGALDTTVLLGSAQILMLQKVRESLAGRVIVFDLWPLMANEIGWPRTAGPPPVPLLELLLSQPGNADALLGTVPNVLVGENATRAALCIDHLLTWGGMPALLPLSEGDRRMWLQAYETTYLERDLGDIARLADLMPFRQLQRIVALRSGGLLNYGDVARDADLPATTARRYTEYLRLSYQAILIPPYFSNLTSSIVKAPKVYWTDLGIWRQLTQYFGAPTGQMFETLVVTEIHKWLRSNGHSAQLYFYRTRSGREVDVVLTTHDGVWTIEIKSAKRLAPVDWRSVREVGLTLGEAWRGGLVVYGGSTVEQLEENVWAIPVGRFLVAS